MPSITLTDLAMIWTSGEDSGKAKCREIAHPIDIGHIFAFSNSMWVTASLHRSYTPTFLFGSTSKSEYLELGTIPCAAIMVANDFCGIGS